MSLKIKKDEIFNSLVVSGPVRLHSDPTEPEHATNKEYVDTMASGGGGGMQKVYETESTVSISPAFGNVQYTDSTMGNILTIAEAGVTAYKPLNMFSNGITNLATPTTGSGAANKGYVDSHYTFVNAGSSVGEVVRGSVGGVTSFRTIGGGTNINVVNNANDIQIGLGIGLKIVNAALFSGATADVRINAAIASADPGSYIIIDDGFAATETLASEILLNKRGITLLFGITDYTYTAVGGNVFTLTKDANYCNVIGKGQGTLTSTAVTHLPALTQFTLDPASGNARHLSGVDVHYLSMTAIRFTGRDYLGSASGGMRFTLGDTNGTQGLFLKDIFIQECGTERTQVFVQTPLYCTFDNLRLTRGGWHALALNAGTTNTIRNCYSSTMLKSGFYLQGTSYTTLSNCASESAGVCYRIRNTNGVTLTSCGVELPAHRDVDYPGHGFQVDAGAEGTSIISPYVKGISTAGTNNVSQRFIDIVDASSTRVVAPTFVDDALTVTDYIHVAATATGTYIETDSQQCLLPENGANVNRLLTNLSSDLLLSYSGKSIHYGSDVLGPVFRDSVTGVLRNLTVDNLGVISSVVWSPP